MGRAYRDARITQKTGRVGRVRSGSNYRPSSKAKCASILGPMVGLRSAVRYVGATEGVEKRFDCAERVQEEAQLVKEISTQTLFHSCLDVEQP